MNLRRENDGMSVIDCSTIGVAKWYVQEDQTPNIHVRLLLLLAMKRGLWSGNQAEVDTNGSTRILSYPCSFEIKFQQARSWRPFSGMRKKRFTLTMCPKRLLLLDSIMGNCKRDCVIPSRRNGDKRSMLRHGILLLYANTPVHRANVTEAAQRGIDFQELLHLLHSSDLAPVIFTKFVNWKLMLREEDLRMMKLSSKKLRTS